jgi:hypothetical protein
MSILLNSTINNRFCRLVMAEVNDFCSRGLNQASHDIDGRIMAVEQGRCSDDSDRAGRRLEHGVFIGHADATGCWFIKSALTS